MCLCLYSFQSSNLAHDEKGFKSLDPKNILRAILETNWSHLIFHPICDISSSFIHTTVFIPCLIPGSDTIPHLIPVSTARFIPRLHSKLPQRSYLLITNSISVLSLLPIIAHKRHCFFWLVVIVFLFRRNLFSIIVTIWVSAAIRV